MPPTSTEELYYTCRLVQVPVGSVRFEETENVLSNNWKGMLNVLGVWLRWKMVVES